MYDEIWGFKFVFVAVKVQNIKIYLRFIVFNTVFHSMY
jgi:hypothetical protein